MPKEKTLEDLFVDQIQDVYFAEGKLHKALGKMAKKCPNPKLAAAFQKHQEETATQIEKLEQVMTSLDIKVKGKKCPAILGIIEEAEEIMSDFKGEDAVLCAGMIAAGQKAEHYEIATYGTLCQWATDLGYKTQAKLLHSILEQEKKTDIALTQLAESGINESAEPRTSKKAA
jgi:ferritin-like metal-binding protein YciE